MHHVLKYPRHVWHVHRTTRLRSLCQIQQRRFTANQIQKYVYKPLRTDEIRILDLQPGHSEEPIVCALRTVTLANATNYESLSYFWGRRNEEEVIYPNNGTLTVTKSLYGALHQLRRTNEKRALWIDAVCINQPDLTERGNQVNLMKQIYQLSKRTVVWLGEEGQNSSHAVQLIAQLAKASRARENGQSSLCVSFELPPLYDLAWSAFVDLLQRPWWHRAWIVQEVSVAKGVLLTCGKDVFTWDDLERAVAYAVDLGFFIAYGGSTISQASGLFQTRANFQKNCKPSLHEVLLQHRSSMATDSRDKVFGFLPLAEQNDVKGVGIAPNYHDSAEALFKAISVSLLEREGLSALKASGIRDKSSKPQLPSWVSDWSVPDPTVALDELKSAQLDSHNTLPSVNVPDFQASLSSVTSPKFNPDRTLLGLEGLLIDQIDAVGALSRTRYLRHVSHMFELFVQCHDILEQLKDWETIARVSSRKERYPATDAKLRDVYWHTLCAGRVPPNLSSAYKDPRYKYYILIRSLRRLVKLTIRWFPRSTRDTWYNRFFYRLFQGAWTVFGMTPTKIQHIGFPPESRLSNHRRMARTEKGYLALVPRYAQKGDWVAIFKGGKIPLIVRKSGEVWVLVGEGYVHGMMNGEVWEEEKCQTMWFT